MRLILSNCISISRHFLVKFEISNTLSPRYRNSSTSSDFCTDFNIIYIYAKIVMMCVVSLFKWGIDFRGNEQPILSFE